MRRCLHAVGFAVCLCSLLGCDLASLTIAQDAEAVQALGRQEGWRLRPAPVIAMGDLMEKGAWNDPTVEKTGDGYIMYLTSSTREAFKPPVLPFRAISRDGIVWKLDPERPLLDTSGTPYVSIETPSVVRFNGKYHMYYTGIMPQGTVPSMAIGHATSTDGITWIKDPDRTAVLKATGDVAQWNGYLVAEPGAIVRGDQVYVYFTAMAARATGKPPQEQVIALAKSADGSNFSDPIVVLRQSALYPASKGFVGYSTPSASAEGDRIHLFYDVAFYREDADPQWSQVALHHAVSMDGGETFREDETPILSRVHLDLKGGEVSGPFGLFEGEKLRMWFFARAPAASFMPEVFMSGKTNKFGIRLAEIDAAQLR